MFFLFSRPFAYFAGDPSSFAGKTRTSGISGISALNPARKNAKIPVRELCMHPIFTRRLFEKVLLKNACGTMWQLFLKNAGTACGKRRNAPERNGLHVPKWSGTSLGQVGTNLGRFGLNPVFAILHRLSRCVGRWDNGTGWDNQILDL